MFFCVIWDENISLLGIEINIRSLTIHIPMKYVEGTDHMLTITTKWHIDKHTWFVINMESLTIML